jgi:hypothetical protein
MGAEQGSLVDVVTAALRYRYSEAEDHASRTPPYPVPEPLRGARDRIAAELNSRPETHDNLAAARIGVEATPVRMLVSALSRDRDINWSDAVCALIATGALRDADLDAIEPELDDRWRPFVMRQRALTRVVNGDVEGAVEIAERMPADSRYRVYRDIGWAAARAGDVELFRRFAKHYEPAKERNGMTSLRAELVSGVAAEHGLDAAVEVARDPSIGTGYLGHTASRIARSGDIAALDAALAGPLAGLIDERARLSLLIEAVAADSPERPQHDHPRLGELLDAIIAIDPSESKDVMRAREAMLFHSWPAIGDEATLKRVRAALRTPNYKRELSRLARDIPAR